MAFTFSYGKTYLCDHSRIQTTKQYPSRNSLLLKDYLRDDLSSCSSSGFKSLPRRQCCTTTVGFKLQRKKRSTCSSSSSKISALHRASEAVINAIKSLPLSQKSTAKAAAGFLSRSFSRKVLFSSRRRFWRKAEGSEEGISDQGKSSSRTRRWRRRSFRELLMEERDNKTTSNEDIIITVPCTDTSSSCGSNKSWGESEFTISSTVTDTVTFSETSAVEGTKEDWSHEEKEQFSPVSVLDCPFEDDEEITPHVNSTTGYLLEGDQHKHTQKRRHFESVASLEPVTLKKTIEWSELEDEIYNHYHAKHCSQLVPIMCNIVTNNVEENVGELLNFVKRSIPSNCLINEQHQEMYSGWEVKERRHVYIREMDREWKNSDQEIQQLALELENEVFTSLVNEVVHDLTMQQVSSSIVLSLL